MSQQPRNQWLTVVWLRLARVMMASVMVPIAATVRHLRIEAMGQRAGPL